MGSFQTRFGHPPFPMLKIRWGLEYVCNTGIIILHLGDLGQQYGVLCTRMKKVH